MSCFRRVNFKSQAIGDASSKSVFFAAVALTGAALSQPSQAASRPNNKPTDEISQGSPTRATVKGVKRPKYQPPCRDPGERESCELEAQWKGADAADKAAWWAIIQTILSAAGVIGLIFSLYYTRKAVRVSESATKDADEALSIAERNADATAQMVEVSKANAVTELRPYLGFDSVRFTVIVSPQGERALIVHFVFENTGATPAKNCCFWGGTQVFPNQEAIAFAPVDTAFGPSIARGKGRSHGFQALTTQQLTAIVKADAIPVFYTKIYYSGNLSEERYEEGFGYRMENILPPQSWLAKLDAGVQDSVQMRQFFQLRSHRALSQST